MAVVPGYVEHLTSSQLPTEVAALSTAGEVEAEQLAPVHAAPCQHCHLLQGKRSSLTS